MKIADIEMRMQQSEPGNFQKMCNEILCKMNYEPYNYTGSQIGTDKTILGTPDSIFLDEKGNYVFVEYTVQESRLKGKIKKDVEKCMKKIKDEKLEEKFSKIIYMHNRKNISLKDTDEIKRMCNEIGIEFTIYDIDFIANKIKNDFPEIAEQYLDLKEEYIAKVGGFTPEAIQQLSEYLKNKNDVDKFKSDDINEIKNKIEMSYEKAMKIINNQEVDIYISEEDREKLEDIYKTLEILEFYYKDKDTDESVQYYHNLFIIGVHVNLKETLKKYHEFPEKIKNNNAMKYLYAIFAITSKDTLKDAETILNDLYFNKKYELAFEALIRCYFLQEKYEKVVDLLLKYSKEKYDKDGYLAAMLIVSTNCIKELNKEEISQFNNQFDNMPLFCAAKAQLLYNIDEDNVSAKKFFKRGLKLLDEKDILAINTMCDVSVEIKLTEEMIKFLLKKELTPVLKLRLVEFLLNKQSLTEKELKELKKMRNEIDDDEANIDVDYIDGVLLEGEGRERKAIKKYEQSYEKRGNLRAVYKYIELSQKNFIEINEEILKRLSLSNELIAVMLVTEVYRYRKEFQKATQNAYKELYILNNDMSNKEVLKQYWGCAAFDSTLKEKINSVHKNVCVTLKSDFSGECKNFVIEDDKTYEEGDTILNVEIIRSTSNLGLELINKKINDEIFYNEQKYTIIKISNKYLFFAGICFAEISDEISTNTIKGNIEESIEQLKEVLLNVQIENNRRLDIYEESKNIPLSFLCDAGKNVEEYLKIINELLTNPNRIFYVGEPRDVVIENGLVIDLTSIIVLAILEKLDIFTDEFCEKIYITASLKNKLKYYYTSLLERQDQKEEMIGVIRQADGSSTLALNELPINKKIEFWSDIYRCVNKFQVEDVEAETNKLLNMERKDIFDKVQFDLMQLAKKKNIPFVCDDLAIRKIANGIYKIEHSNCITLIERFYKDDKYIEIITKLVKHNYLYAIHNGKYIGSIFIYLYKNYNVESKSKVETIIKEILKTKEMFLGHIGILINMINTLKRIQSVKIFDKVYPNKNVVDTINMLVENIKKACGNLELDYKKYEKYIDKE